MEETAPVPRREFDIFATKVAKFLDPHLVLAVLNNVRAHSGRLPLLPLPPLSTPPLPSPPRPPPSLPSSPPSQFTKDSGLYDSRSVLEATLAIAKRTRLVGFSLDLFESLQALPDAGPPDAAELERLHSAERAYDTEFKACVSACGPLIDIVGLTDDAPPEVLTRLREEDCFTMEVLSREHGVTPAHLQALYATAKVRYDAGWYLGTYEYLRAYEALRYPKRDDVPLELTWGKFATALVADTLKEADEERMHLAEALKRRPPSVLPDIQRLQQRTWLLHWSLFLLSAYPARREALIEFYMQEENLMCVSLTCPWLLRYIIAAVLPHRRFKQVYARALVRLLTPEALALADPFVTFLHALLVDFDFVAAQKVIQDCRDACATDFFLERIASATFLSTARGFLFDVYCRVHQKIDLRALASQVHMSEDEAEKWVVGLIRSADLDAKVDSEARTIEMLQAAPSV